MKIIRRVMKNMDVLYGIENPNFKDLKHDRPYLFNHLLPWLPKFLFTIGKINSAHTMVRIVTHHLLPVPVADTTLRGAAWFRGTRRALRG